MNKLTERVFVWLSPGEKNYVMAQAAKENVPRLLRFSQYARMVAEGLVYGIEELGWQVKPLPFNGKRVHGNTGRYYTFRVTKEVADALHNYAVSHGTSVAGILRAALLDNLYPGEYIITGKYTMKG